MTNETKQTAVEMIFESFFNVKWADMQDSHKPVIFLKAKEMEKQQIINLRENGLLWGVRSTNNFYYDKIIESKDYYDKTYGGNK